MPENGTLKVKLHNLIKDHSFLFHENNPYLDNETNTKLYILDGQQRMTSIAKLFLACDSQINIITTYRPFLLINFQTMK